VTREVLDFGRPVALMLVAILHFIATGPRPAPVEVSFYGGVARKN
jgi:hypothetical protein